MADLEFKVLIAGPLGAGKTTFLKRFEHHRVNVENVDVEGIEIVSLQFQTTDRRRITFHCWDPVGEDVNDVYYNGGDCAVMMFDVTQERSNSNLVAWFDNVKRMLPHAYIVVCGNKIDQYKKVLPHRVKVFGRQKDLDYFEISALSNQNIHSPLLCLAQNLANDRSLRFVDPSLLEAEKYVSRTKLRKRQSHADDEDDDNSDDDLEEPRKMSSSNKEPETHASKKVKLTKTDVKGSGVHVDTSHSSKKAGKKAGKNV